MTKLLTPAASEGAAQSWHASDIDDACLSLSGRALESADLSAVPPSLRAVSLAANRLARLSLAPLAACSRLESLVLNGNALVAIDLAPLAGCTRLEKLWLHNNALRSLDLTPLAQCASLRSLYLDGNKIDAETVDLAPLEACRHLRSLRLGRNQLAGELDITPILSCASLSSLDVSASVRLVASLTSSALCAQTASASLPPALRRKAATVMWRSAPEDDVGNQSEDSLCESSDELEDQEGSLSRPMPAVCNASEDAGMCVCASGCTKNAVAKRPSPLDELRKLPSAQKTSRVYTALMLGFQGNTQYSIVSLLEEHGSLKTICIPTQSAEVSPTSLVSSGALKKCHVILLRPQAESMILGLRTFDTNMPIIVVGNSNNPSDSVKRCMRKGATTFLPEPLSTRDALTIRAHAQRRARAVCGSSRKRSSKPVPDKMRLASAAYRITLDVDAIENGLPTSPVTSSESSPPSGVPTVPFELSLHQGVTLNGETTLLTQVRLDKPLESNRILEPISSPKKELPMIKKLVRQRNERSHSVRARIESSGLNMVFSRSGGYAARENFRSIATICGLPMCVGPVLFDAAKIWIAKMEASGKLRSCLPRKTFTLSKVGSAPALSRVGSGTAAHRLSALKRRNSAPPDIGNVVTYEQFVQFWESNLRQHDCERRLFVITSIANHFATAVPLAAVSQLACNFMLRRSSSVEEFSLCGDTVARDARAANLAARVVCYELQGGLRSRLSQGELIRASLCSSLLSAESGIYNGVTAHLRTDRLRGIRSAFVDACGASGAAPAAAAVAAFNAERGLLTPRAVEALFARYVPAEEMTVLEFAPMWLATHDLTSQAASSYLFGVLDANQDGYVCAADVAHFYSEKCAMLSRDGFVPVRFEHIWHSILDNLGHGRSVSPHGRKQLSLAEFHKVSERDRVTFWQSVLFMEDELASVDCYRTVTTGGLSAASAVRATF